MHVLTMSTLATLPRARALARSLRRHQPDWPHEIVLLGREDRIAPAVEAEDSLCLRSASEELDLDVERLIARHDEHDLSVLLLPRLLETCAQRVSAPVLHLPPTAWVLAGLEPVASALSRHSVLLVPRVSADLPDDGLEPSRTQLLRCGRIAQNIMAVNRSARASEFLSWWAGRVEEALGSLDGRKTGARPEDRPWLARYLELAPARFWTAVLDDGGCNLSMWNLHEPTLERRPEGLLVDERWPLRFVDLPGFDPHRPHRLSALASRVRVSRSPVLRELCVRYAAELQQAGWCDADHHRDIGRRLFNGLVFDEPMRSLYARSRALGEDFGDLFSEQGAQAFASWLEGPAPEGGAHGITRYVFYRVARERPDVMRAYPILDGADGAEYIRWCWGFGRHELGIPDRFMPPSPAGEQLPVSQTAGGLRSGAVFDDALDEEHAPTSSSHTEPAANTPRDADGAQDAQDLSDAENGPVAGGEPLAVRVTGYLGHSLGLGAAARGYVRALSSVGVSVTTASVPLHHLALPVAMAEEYGRHGFEDLIHDGGHGFEIVAVNADELPDFVERLGEDYFEGPRIGIWGWETNSIPSRWERAFSLIDEIWVYSRFMAKNIGSVAPVPVLSLPPPVLMPVEPPERRRLGVPEGFLFLFVFDYLSTIQRKNPVGLIEAFKSAFRVGEGPQLLLKTINGPLRPLAEEEVLWAAHGRPDIHLIDRSLSSDEVMRLMAGCDCYVSLHRAEGFGLTIAEAMSLGKPVIATGYSGNVDFMTAENSYLVDHAIGRVGPDCEIYPPDGEWAEPSVEHAAELMRRVYSAPTEAATRGARARADVTRLLSPAATGANMRRRLERLAGAPHPRNEHLVPS
jgi:glycosyltransferase involved in cell wall biosynthesis